MNISVGKRASGIAERGVKVENDGMERG